jgi:hypothetical protein
MRQSTEPHSMVPHQQTRININIRTGTISINRAVPVQHGINTAQQTAARVQYQQGIKCSINYGVIPVQHAPGPVPCPYYTVPARESLQYHSTTFRTYGAIQPPCDMVKSTRP